MAKTRREAQNPSPKSSPEAQNKTAPKSSPEADQNDVMDFDELSGDPGDQEETEDPVITETPDPVKPDGKIYGNQDKEKRYPLKKDWLKKIVVRQLSVERASNGEMIRLQSTAAIQTYDPAYFNKLLKDNFFSESRMEVEVLHRP
ncbi:MAG TPA: hypothetical protein PK339_12505 [Flavitalea sp.]|nr:hypothetical protein [Flavitalea sp.]